MCKLFWTGAHSIQGLVLYLAQGYTAVLEMSHTATC